MQTRGPGPIYNNLQLSNEWFVIVRRVIVIVDWWTVVWNGDQEAEGFEVTITNHRPPIYNHKYKTNNYKPFIAIVNYGKVKLIHIYRL